MGDVRRIFAVRTLISHTFRVKAVDIEDFEIFRCRKSLQDTTTRIEYMLLILIKVFGTL